MGAAIRGQQTPTEILSNETCPNPAPRDTRQHGIGTSAQVLAPSKLPGNLDPWDFFWLVLLPILCPPLRGEVVISSVTS